MLNPRFFSVVALLISALCGLHTQAVEAQSGKYPSHTMVSYMSWLPSYYNSRGIAKPTDFPVMSLLDRNGQLPKADERQLYAVGNELKLLSDHGWDCMLADFLFFEPSNVIRHIASTRNMLNAADRFDLPADFKIASFIESLGGQAAKDPVFLGQSIVKYLKEVGDNPRHLKIEGRPVMLFYGGDRRSAEDWRKALAVVREQGCNPFVIYEHGGLMPAIYGRFDPAKTDGFGDMLDGCFNFAASALEAATQMPGFFRKTYDGKKVSQYVGGTIWPGYLSDRSVQRNFVSPRHTEFLRSVWEKTLVQKPDFLQWSTWNDYHEATSLSCTYSQLTSRMEISQRYLSRYNNKPLPESEEGKPQSVLSYRKALQTGEPVIVEFLPLPAANVTGKAKITVKLLDDHNALIALQHSDWLDMQQLDAWKWNYDNGVDRNHSRVIRVRASLELEDGSKIDYANLPDIAMVRGTNYSDQLYYNVPLHRLADNSRSLHMLVNGQDGATGQPALHEGVRVIDYRVIAVDVDKTQVSAMRNGQLLRFLAPLDCDNAYSVNPNEGERPIALRKRSVGEVSSYCDWRKPKTREGEDYYAAVVQFADGKWAYSSTVWSVPSTSYDQTSVLWSFVPQHKKGEPRT
ncbi:MAG: hypothetical protein JKX85_13950 [Phycisphaeraceae bacterium]|nr:hypothetical protein [Phycisphaeraceae bacterium]